MKLENSFTIDAPLDKAWQALNTPETIAPCFPGATLTEYEGDTFVGTVKVKLGPISLTYKGKGTYVSRDDDAHRVVIEADGRDSRGNGTAKATVTGSMSADGPDRTAVTMVTDMQITGKPAQFGRGVISDVADKIIGQFAACVASKLAPADPSDGGGAADSPPSPTGAGSGGSAAGAPGARAASTGAAAGKKDAAATGSGTDAAAAAERAVATAQQAKAEAAEASAAARAGRPDPTGAAAASTAASARSTAQSAQQAAQTEAARPASNGTSTGPRPVPAPVRAPLRSEIDAIDLLDTAGAPVLKRLVPVLGGAVLLTLIILLIRRLRA